MNMTLVVHCKKCGHGKILASGYNAMAMSHARRIFILSKIGWQAAPVVLCRSCACPMDWWEMKEAEGKKDFALRLFKDKMRKKYGAVLDKWFETIPSK